MAQDGARIPSRYLMTLVAGTSDWRWFLRSGEAAAQAIAVYAAEAGCDLAEAEHILDFGCGCGRIARHMRKHSGARLAGVDYNPALVRWCARNLDGDFAVNQLRPPLDLPGGRFDLVYLYSIFTHLRIDTQRAWLAEFARILKPGGTLLVSFHDEDHPGLPDTHPAREQMAAQGFHIHNNHGEGPNFVATFQTRDFVRSAFGDVFEIVRIVPSGETPMGQAMAIMRHRAG